MPKRSPTSDFLLRHIFRIIIMAQFFFAIGLLSIFWGPIMELISKRLLINYQKQYPKDLTWMEPYYNNPIQRFCGQFTSETLELGALIVTMWSVIIGGICFVIGGVILLAEHLHWQ